MQQRYHFISVTARGGPEVLKVEEGVVPEPGPDDVRVRTLAAGVSAYDLMLRSRWFPGFPRLPYTPGVDVVGIVDKVGHAVSTVAPGHMVAATTGLDGGGYAEVMCLPSANWVPVPPGVDPAAAVCVVANYLTADLAMHETARVEIGDRILIQGAAGGVGTALLELGRLAGLEMYGTASQHNHELVSSLGATPIDYRNEDFVARVSSLTGDGVDVVFDPIGGARQLWRSYQTLRGGGKLVWFGVAATSREGIRVIPLSLAARFALALIPDGKKAPLMPDAGTTSRKNRSWYRETLADLFDHLAAGKIEPVIAARVPLLEAARAHELLEQGGHAGKVVLIADT